MSGSKARHGSPGGARQCARHGLILGDETILPGPMEVTVGNRRAEVVGRKPRGQAEGSGKQTFDRRNTNRQEAAYGR